MIHFFCSVSSPSADGSGISCTALKSWDTCSNGTIYASEESCEKGENKLGVNGTDWAEALEGTGTTSVVGAGEDDLESESGKMKVANAMCWET